MQDGESTPTASLVAVDEDAACVRAVRRSLEAGGIEVTDAGEVAVIVISQASVENAAWRARLTDHRFVRLVPVRVDRVSSSKVPELSSLNWIIWNHDAPVTTCGSILAAVATEPEKLWRLRDLRAQADVWARTGHHVEHLMGDPRRARDAERFLAELAIDENVPGNETVARYVRLSRAQAGRSRRWRWIRGWGAVAVASLVALAVAAAVPLIAKAKQTNFDAVVTTGDRRVEQQEPEWSSLLAGAMLLNGDAGQKELARLTLGDTLSVPWSQGTLNVGVGYSLEGMQPLGRGERSVVRLRAHSGVPHLGIYDVRSGAVLYHVAVGGIGELTDMDASPDGRTVVAVGPAGLAVMDTATGHVRTLPVRLARESVVVCLLRDGRVAVANDAGVLETVSPRGGTVRRSGAFGEILSLEATTHGGARALVRRGRNDYALVDAASGRVLAQGTVADPLVPTGGVAPDADYGVVTGADRQLWRLVPGHAPVPTGVAVSDRTYLTVVLPGERVAIGGQDQPMRVLHLPTHSDLGIICRDVPQVTNLRVSRDGTTANCLGYKADAVWQVPDGPVTGPVRVPLSSAARAEADGVLVESEGRRTRIRYRRDGKSYQSGWMTLFAGDVSAVAVSPDGRQVVIGSVAGDVAVVTTQTSTALRLVKWRVPDSSSVRALGWRDTDPVVQAADGHTWRVDGCPGCSTDQGLIKRLVSRMKGCWTAPAQLHSLDAATRRTLHAHLCGPLPPVLEG
ncbi:hypothetical protein [Streptomyces sp. NPDC050548]|uniref:hypothetical protein n=1 Tax=Streptomyces sp. NPDC050548 TaxID=3365629 RepID=UPI0037ACED8F